MSDGVDDRNSASDEAASDPVDDMEEYLTYLLEFPKLIPGCFLVDGYLHHWSEYSDVDDNTARKNLHNAAFQIFEQRGSVS